MAIVAPPCLSASAPSAWINPTRHPVTVRVDVATETTLQLEVSRQGGLVHRGAPASVPGGRAALVWNGRGASADGLYEVGVEFLHDISQTILTLIRHLYSAGTEIPSSVTTVNAPTD